MLNRHVLTNLKAYAALIGGILTALLGIYGPDTTVGHWLTVGLAVLTAVVTWTVPYLGTSAPENTDDGE